MKSAFWILVSYSVWHLFKIWKEFLMYFSSQRVAHARIWSFIALLRGPAKTKCSQALAAKCRVVMHT